MSPTHPRPGAGQQPRRLRLAYFSPLPPEKSGIADYSRELLPALAEVADVTVFAAAPQAVSTAVSDHFSVRDAASFAEQQRAFDLPLYHIGNSEYHDWIIPLAEAYPGVVVLHDVFLHHATARRTLGAGNLAAYAREMGYARGPRGVRQALAVGEGTLAPPVFEEPLAGRLLDAGLGVLVHSRFAAAQVRRLGYAGPLHVVPALISRYDSPSRRAELGLPDDAVLFASFGLITAEKQIASVLQALHRLRDEFPTAHYLLAGERTPGVPVEALARDLGLEEAVHVLGFVPDLATFAGWMAAADVVINLRDPTVGETSATALRALVAGRPLLVTDHGWYAELPDDVALRLPPGDDEALLAGMRVLAASPNLRRRLGAAARAYAQANHAPAVVARAYDEALRATMATHLFPDSDA